MKKLKQTIGFFIEAMSFVIGGYLVGINNSFGYLIVLFGFIMAYIVGKQIEKDVKKWMYQISEQ